MKPPRKYEWKHSQEGEAKKVAIGVVSGVLGIAVLFALILMIVGKGDEPVCWFSVNGTDGLAL
jgi:hypothetical protein